MNPPSTLKLPPVRLDSSNSGSSLIAYPDTYRVHANTTLSVPSNGVFANDSPSTGVIPSRITNAGYGPFHGGATLFTDGSFTYTPATGYVGSDFFTYVNRDYS